MLKRAAVAAAVGAAAIGLTAAPAAAETTMHLCEGGSLSGQTLVVHGGSPVVTVLSTGSRYRVTLFEGEFEGFELDKKTGQLVPVAGEFTKQFGPHPGTASCSGEESFSDPRTGESGTFRFDVTLLRIGAGSK